MKLQVRTRVAQPPMEVFRGFNGDLFDKLAPPTPPFPPAKLLRYDGEHPGDEVHIQLNMGVRKELWISEITDRKESAEECYFVDEGRELPWFLTRWRHKHWLVASGTGTEIIEDIDFRTPAWLPEFLMYPALYAQFAYRKPIYRREFGVPPDDA